MKIKSILSIILLSAGTSVLSVWGYQKFAANNPNFNSWNERSIPVNYANYIDKTGEISAPSDFEQPAAIASPTVVHITTKIPSRAVSNSGSRSRGSLFDQFFGDAFGDMMPRGGVIPEQRASGSGVIISEDGYIVTNNHVISNGNNGVVSDITITLSNRKTYTAKVIGNDPNSDLAVLKIDATKLPYLIFGNSDQIKIGQWVLAIGYPLGLETTVTAGIVSAKARSIGINARQATEAGNSIESFIQTDAAVNQGNSGGALVNTKGELIGINSAIASPTGTYAGYSYAIPANVTKKIVGDLIKYGSVQRAYIGIKYPNEKASPEALKELGINPFDNPGVYVLEVLPDGAAAAAGLKVGDIITKINGEEIATGPELMGKVATYKIGEKIKVTFKRNDKLQTIDMTLKNSKGTLAEVESNIAGSNLNLGAEMVTLPADKAKDLGIKGGVLVKNITDGIISDQTRMTNGFIIMKVGNTPVSNLEELKAALAKAGNSTTMEGIYPGSSGVYFYSINDLQK